MTKILLATMAIAASASMAFSPTSSAEPTDPAALPAFRPCDWVTAQEASDILGKPVRLTPSDDAAGSNDPRCYYAVSGDGIGVGISSELFLPDTPAVADGWVADAAAQPGSVLIGGLGMDAMCVFEPNVTPPATTVEVEVDSHRIYRATATYEYCDTVERFARTAVARIEKDAS